MKNTAQFKLKLLTIGTLSAFSIASHAAEWKTEAGLGFLMTGGNSETQSTNAKLSTVRDTEKWTQSGSLEALGASSTDTATEVETTTAEKYVAKAKGDYKVSKANFLFIGADYNDDRFSGFDYQATIAAGYGRNILQNEKQTLKAEVGPGVLFDKPNGEESDNEGIIRLAANYEYKFSGQASFTQDLTVDIAEDFNITESVSALTAKISNRMAMKASFKARNTSEVPLNTEETDTETALTLVYSF